MVNVRGHKRKVHKLFHYKVGATTMLGGRIWMPVRNRTEAKRFSNKLKRENKISKNNAGYLAYKNIKIKRR